jgi:hypothetical protein
VTEEEILYRRMRDCLRELKILVDQYDLHYLSSNEAVDIDLDMGHLVFLVYHEDKVDPDYIYDFTPDEQF